MEAKKILFIGVGNNGRADDALGWALAEALVNNEEFAIELRYQLQIEDALLISEYQQVIIADATEIAYPAGYAFYRCKPTRTEAFTTHQLAPETVLFLVEELFQQKPEVYVMAVSGSEWELGIGMSQLAQENLQRAVGYLAGWLVQFSSRESLRTEV